MFFRFGIVVVTLVALAMARVAIEKRNVELRREIGVQEYRLRQLEDRRARLRLEIERLSAPERLSDRLGSQEKQLR